MAGEMVDRWNPFWIVVLFSSKFEGLHMLMAYQVYSDICPRDFILLSIWIHTGENSESQNGCKSDVHP